MKARTVFDPIILAVLLSLLPWGGLLGGRPAVCFALTPPAQIKILPQVQVKRNRVTLFDLCDPTVKLGAWKAIMQKVEIGEAPPVDSVKYISEARLRPYLQRFLRKHGCDPEQVTLTIPNQITITRKTMQLTPAQVKSIYKRFVWSKSLWDRNDVKIHHIYFPALPELPSGKLTYTVSSASNQSFIGNVGITIHFLVDGQQESSLSVMGRVDLYQKVVESSRALGQNTVIQASDIELAKANVADHPESFATSGKQVIGMQLLRDIGPHQPIFVSDLTHRRVVREGTLVTMLYQRQGLRLTAAGQAREGGCVGDTIRVTNVMTKRTVLCQIVNDDTVRAVQ